MQIYLVGGAVRDKILGRHVHERDWVVVGATPEEMEAKGFKQVGRDFPVFLHPKTHEEYALARTERKTGKGYYGFQCEFSPAVTLEDDLLRRDLTVNAIAIDEEGKLIDPYGGVQDIEHKILRHVSDAFVEDPVRVLRLARFKARFHELGFRVADETRVLAYQMVRHGELQHLVPERVWQEWERSLTEANPEQFIMMLRQVGALQVVLPELEALFGVPAAPKRHPEIDSGVHTLQVLERARRLKQDSVLAFSACVHDVGKAVTPMSEWPSQCLHDERGVKLVKQLCERLKLPRRYRDAAMVATAYHLKIHQAAELSPEESVQTLVAVGAFRDKQHLERLLLLCEADSLEKPYTQRQFWQNCLAACSAIDTAALVAKGLVGQAMQMALHQARVETVRQYCET